MEPNDSNIKRITLATCGMRYVDVNDYESYLSKVDKMSSGELDAELEELGLDPVVVVQVVGEIVIDAVAEEVGHGTA